MNLLDLFQLGQCRGDLSNWWENMFAMEGSQIGKGIP